MDWRAWVGLLLLVPIAGFGLVRMRQIWSGEDLSMQELGTSQWWPLGAALRRGFIRGIAVGVVTCAALVLCLVFVGIAEHTSGSVSSAANSAGIAALLVIVVLILVNASITLFNRPRFAVPPPLRDEPGALALWWRGRHHRAGA
jgi:hypothetical protein